MSITSSTDLSRARADIERFRRDRLLLRLLCGLSALAGVMLIDTSRPGAVACGVIWLCASVALFTEARRAIRAVRVIERASWRGSTAA